MASFLAHLFSSQRLLSNYLDGEFPTPKQALTSIFQQMRERDSLKPDYLHRHAISMQQLENASLSEMLMSCLEKLSEPLFFRGNEIRVKCDAFDSWQRTIALTSPLPLLVTKIRKEVPQERWKQWLKIVSAKSTFPSPFIPEIESMIQESGLQDLHLHINGTSEADYVWIDAIRNPLAIHKYIREKRTNPEICELYQQLDRALSPNKIYRHLRIAKTLRSLLWYAIENNRAISKNNLLKRIDSLQLQPHIPISIESNDISLYSEALLLILSMQHLHASNTQYFANAFHLYLLFRGQFINLLVQQANQWGFDQFNKISGNNLREYTEKRFSKRFKQLEGMYGEDLSCLEARIAPKKTTMECFKLLRTIINEYEKYAFKNHQDTALNKAVLSSERAIKKKRMNMTLVFHFIKKRDAIPKEFSIVAPRFYSLRKTLKRQSSSIIFLRKSFQWIREYLCGIDAAGNELHTPPEVFAPTYRYLRNNGIVHFTYHAGEDFYHLLSGMRALFETMEYLDLQPGDRIGHATAIGIQPALWRARAGATSYLPMGEWLDNMIFVFSLLSEVDGMSEYVIKAEREALEYAHRIFDTDAPLTASTLQEFWRLRWQDPLEKDFPQKGSLHCKKILRSYHSAPVYRQSQSLIEVPNSFLPDDVYSALQQRVIKSINSKQIVVETMPSSNVAISYYSSYHEHHIFRWLGLSEQVNKADEISSV